MMIDRHSCPARWAPGLAVAGAVLLGGCAVNSNPSFSGIMGSGTGVTVSDPARLTESGFLSNYGRLKPVKWADGIQCWSDPGLKRASYTKVSVAPVVVKLKPGQTKGVDPADLKKLTDYFQASMVKALQPEFQVVDQPGPGVLEVRIALTNLVPTQVAQSVVGTAVPYGFVAEAASGKATGRPVGSTPYLGETGIELQLRVGQSGRIGAECRDTQIGRKYAAELDKGAVGAAQTWASGYLNSFQSWSYAKNAFDKWSALTAQRLAALRGAS